MKKQIIITALAIATSLSAFAQGYVSFASTKAQGVWFAPNATNSGSAAGLGNAAITVGFLWANSGTPLVGSTGTPTTNNVPADWTPILTDPNFHFGFNNNTAALATQPLNNSGLAQGGWSYNGGVSFPVTGTTAGSTIEILAVAWSSQYSTPQAAAAGGSFLGWSSLFNYATGPTSGSAVSSFALSGMPAFGVQPVPEPATFALAGLGAAAMLILRRRK